MVMKQGAKGFPRLVCSHFTPGPSLRITPLWCRVAIPQPKLIPTLTCTLTYYPICHTLLVSRVLPCLESPLAGEQDLACVKTLVGEAAVCSGLELLAANPVMGYGKPHAWGSCNSKGRVTTL